VGFVCLFVCFFVLLWGLGVFFALWVILQKALTVYCNLMCDLSVCLFNILLFEVNPWSICPLSSVRGI